MRYPEISVALLGHDGNAMFILSKVRNELKRGGVPPKEIEQFTNDAMDGDYDHLLRTVMDWVNVE